MFALCALDIAYNDLYAQKERNCMNCGCYTDKNPLTDYTIGASIEKWCKMKELHLADYKIKLGTKEDIAIVKELRKHSNAIFRIDIIGFGAFGKP
jgi:hypothetical protein